MVTDTANQFKNQAAHLIYGVRNEGKYHTISKQIF
jgi:hypothetical protein